MGVSKSLGNDPVGFIDGYWGRASQAAPHWVTMTVLMHELGRIMGLGHVPDTSHLTLHERRFTGSRRGMQNGN